MSVELSCHLVDLTVLRTSVSLTLGYLQAFAGADPRIAGRCHFSTQCRSLGRGIEPVWRDIERSLQNPPAHRQVFGFTNFFWNTNANVMLARRIKKLRPDALIVFGGNEVTDQANMLLTGDSPVDVIVNGEGEAVFANLLALYLDSGADFHSVNGVSFRHHDEGIVTTPAHPRIDTLDMIPSPFLSGAMSPKQLSTSVDVAYEFSRGCPFKCAFCHWGAAIGTNTRRFSRDRIHEDLDFIISHSGSVRRIWMADANFGMTDADVEIAYLLAELVQRHHKQILLMTNWAKNTTKRVVEAAAVLYRHGIIASVTLSAQSLNDDVLRIAQRKNIPFSYYEHLQQQFGALGVPTYTELIYGMPGESYESFLSGIAKVISAGGTPVIHPLILLNNTEYSRPEMRLAYKIESKFMRYMGHGVNDADILVGHSLLSYPDWLRGMGLRVTVPVFQGGIMKFMMRRLHVVRGVDYESMLDALVRYCMEGRIERHSLFQEIFEHYIASWDSPEHLMDIPSVSKDNQFGQAHYLALMKAVLQDGTSADALIDELSGVIADAAGVSPDAEFAGWLEYQKLLIRAMSQVIHRVRGPIRTSMTTLTLSSHAGYPVAVDEGSCRSVRVRNTCRDYTPDDFLYRVFLGGVDTLQVLGNVESESSGAAALAVPHAESGAQEQV